ncbi:MAG: hypothetical protein ABL907_02535 [Hyphomicrobium sp.]
MPYRFAVVLAIALGAATSDAAQAQPKPPTFFRDGGWSGEVQADRWGALDTARAWAIGRHSKATAEEACSGRNARERAACARGLRRQPAIRIFADCTAGVAWQAVDKTRYGLTEAAKSGQAKPLDDDAAWTTPMSHRAKWTVASWLGFLCPSISKPWRLRETG